MQGTISYMSPEQIRDDPAIDYRTDIYSLGSVLYEVLAGVPPVGGDTVDEILNQTLSRESLAALAASRKGGTAPGWRKFA